MGNRQLESQRLVDSLPWGHTLELHRADPTSGTCIRCRYLHFGLDDNDSKYVALADLNPNGTGYGLELPLFILDPVNLRFKRVTNGNVETMEVRLIHTKIPYIECVYTVEIFCLPDFLSRVYAHAHLPASCAESNG